MKTPSSAADLAGRQFAGPDVAAGELAEQIKDHGFLLGRELMDLAGLAVLEIFVGDARRLEDLLAEIRCR